MANITAPEVLIPILLNIVLAVATVLYLLETRASRQTLISQFEISQRQHFVTTTPFLYAGGIKRSDDSSDLNVIVINPGERLARDVSCVLYEADKKTFRYPSTTKVVVKPDQTISFCVGADPFTSEEVMTRLRKFYGTDQGIDTHLITTSKTCYVLLMFTDIEGSVYSVKALFSWDDEDRFSRQRSKFQKLSDPQNT